MKIKIELFGKTYEIDTEKDQGFEVIDQNTKMIYWVSNQGANIEIISIEEINEAIAGPSGEQCPMCKGSGIV